MNKQAIIQIVKKLAQKNLEDVLNEFHIDIVYDDKMLYGDLARIVCIDDCCILFLKSDVTYMQKKFLILHELGHYVLHRSHLSTTCNMRQKEHEANLFACYYLLIEDTLQDIDIIDLLKRKGVPPHIANTFFETIQH